MQSKKEMPLEHKPILTIREASFYTGISEKKLIRKLQVQVGHPHGKN